MMKLSERWIKVAPSRQGVLDIFKGEWSSQLPGEFATLNAGQIPLFDDQRLVWAMQQMGGVQGKRILELGPLEGGHTYMLEQQGVQEIVAVEVSTRAYLKCLVVKELLGLKKAHFLCGDCLEYLRVTTEQFDSCVASGILYHMRDPVEFLVRICRVAQQVYLWTHYYDPDILSQKPKLARHFSKPVQHSYAGISHQLYRQNYGRIVRWNGFFGGSDTFSYWLDRDTILNVIRQCDMTNIQIHFEEPDHPNGPCFALVASR